MCLLPSGEGTVIYSISSVLSYFDQTSHSQSILLPCFCLCNSEYSSFFIVDYYIAEQIFGASFGQPAEGSTLWSSSKRPAIDPKAQESLPGQTGWVFQRGLLNFHQVGLTLHTQQGKSGVAQTPLFLGQQPDPLPYSVISFTNCSSHSSPSGTLPPLPPSPSFSSFLCSFSMPLLSLSLFCLLPLIPFLIPSSHPVWFKSPIILLAPALELHCQVIAPFLTSAPGDDIITWPEQRPHPLTRLLAAMEKNE